VAMITSLSQHSQSVVVGRRSWCYWMRECVVWSMNAWIDDHPDDLNDV
jgi:hypothetical protein